MNPYAHSQSPITRSTQLMSFISRLKMHIRTVFTVPDFEPEKIQADILDQCLAVRSSYQNQHLDEVERSTLNEINRLSKILFSVVEERLKVQKITATHANPMADHYSLEKEEPRNGNQEESSVDGRSELGRKEGHGRTDEASSVTFEVITQEDISKGAITGKHKPNRLQEDQVLTLNKWYDEHFSHPYADSTDLKDLTKVTRLSEAQIRNWYVIYLLNLPRRHIYKY